MFFLHSFDACKKTLSCPLYRSLDFTFQPAQSLKDRRLPLLDFSKSKSSLKCVNQQKNKIEYQSTLRTTLFSSHQIFKTFVHILNEKEKKCHPQIQCLSNCCPFAFSSTNPSPAGPAAKHRAGPNLWVGERKYCKSLSSSSNISRRLSPQVSSVSQILLFSFITT